MKAPGNGRFSYVKKKGELVLWKKLGVCGIFVGEINEMRRKMWKK